MKKKPVPKLCRQTITLPKKLVHDALEKLQESGYRGRTLRRQIILLLNQWLEE